MRVTDKGQVTIPIEVRRYLGIQPGDEVEFEVAEDRQDRQDRQVRLVRSAEQPSRGKRAIERLRGSGTVNMTTDEIMALTRGE
jgi:AbrB family looped-hinge helix DNA binding protein